MTNKMEKKCIKNNTRRKFTEFTELNTELIN